MVKDFDIAEDGTVTGTATIPLDQIVDGDLEWLLDEISEQVTGTVLLQDFSYKMESIDPEQDTITFSVTGIVNKEDLANY